MTINVIIVDLHSVLKRTNVMLESIGYGNKISAQTMVEMLFNLGSSEDFDLTFWSYVEGVLTQDEIDNLADKAQKLSLLIEATIGYLYGTINMVLGIKPPEAYKFLGWLGTDAMISIDPDVVFDKKQRGYQQPTNKLFL